MLLSYLANSVSVALTVFQRTAQIETAWFSILIAKLV